MENQCMALIWMVFSMLYIIGGYNSRNDSFSICIQKNSIAVILEMKAIDIYIFQPSRQLDFPGKSIDRHVAAINNKSIPI